VKLILTESVENLGTIGEVVDVAAGYGRNCLMLGQKAIPATSGNMKMLENKMKNRLVLENKMKEDALELAKSLEDVSITASVQVGEEDRMFGSVTQQQISDLLKEKGYEVDRRKIDLDEPIKALGRYTIRIKLSSKVEAEVKLWVVKE